MYCTISNIIISIPNDLKRQFFPLSLSSSLCLIYHWRAKVFTSFPYRQKCECALLYTERIVRLLTVARKNTHVKIACASAKVARARARRQQCWVSHRRDIRRQHAPQFNPPPPPAAAPLHCSSFSIYVCVCMSRAWMCSPPSSFNGSYASELRPEEFIFALFLSPALQRRNIRAQCVRARFRGWCALCFFFSLSLSFLLYIFYVPLNAYIFFWWGFSCAIVGAFVMQNKRMIYFNGGLCFFSRSGRNWIWTF